MDENLITKKDLLALTGISYGSLYRWKRQKLIPDQWFIHRSTFTGQETFFPREEILERIKRIQDLKDGMSLDEIAETFSPATREVNFTPAMLETSGLAARPAIDLFLAATNDPGPYSFERLFQVYFFDRLLKAGDLGRDDAVTALMLIRGAHKMDGGQQFLALRKLGVTTCLLVEAGNQLTCDRECKVIMNTPLAKWVAELKEAISKAGL
jgi:hypothetical protein